MTEANTTETLPTATTEVVKRTPFERVTAGLETVKKMFTGQEEKYKLNPKRVELLKVINERLAPLSVNEERSIEIVKEAEKFAGSRSVKWTNDLLEYANAKSYAESELRDKINNMNPSAERLVYELVLKAVETWEDIPVAFPCPWNTCQCNDFVKTERKEDGKFYTACTNPKHMLIKTSVGHETESESVSEWNRLVQNN